MRCASTFKGLQCEHGAEHEHQTHEAWNADDGYRRTWSDEDARAERDRQEIERLRQENKQLRDRLNTAWEWMVDL